MPIYSFSALSAQGAEVSGEQAALSEQALRAELSGQGLLVRRVRAKRGGLGFGTRRRVRPEDFALFNQEFLALLRAGLTIPDSLGLACERPDSPALGRILERVRDDVRAGLLLSDACARHPEAFELLYVAALRTGEKSGNLADVLRRYQDSLRQRVALRTKLSQALAYPVFLLITLGVVLAVLFVFVMPRFVAMYADLGAQLPWPTRMLLGAVEQGHFLVPAVLAAAAGTLWIWRRWAGTAAGRLRIDRLKERLPYVGELTRRVASAQLARSLSTLLAGGTPLVEALHAAAGSLTNHSYLDRLSQAAQQVTEGASLAQAVRATRLMPEMAARMIQVGEASGGLDAMLAEVAQFHEEALDDRLARVIALVEPLLMLLMGVMIGGIIVVMYLPVFHMADVIR